MKTWTPIAAVVTAFAAAVTLTLHHEAQIASQYYTIHTSDITEVLACYPFRTHGESFAVTVQGDTVTFNAVGCYESFTSRNLCDRWQTDSIKVRPARVTKHYEKNSTAFRWDWE